MAINLKAIPFSKVEAYIPDFQKRARNYDNVPANAELLGIFSGEALAGYFIVTGYKDGDLEINHGYLNKNFRHRHVPALAMQLLEQQAKRKGFKKVVLASSRTLKAYTEFMRNLGYKAERIIFSKGLI